DQHRPDLHQPRPLGGRRPRARAGPGPAARARRLRRRPGHRPALRRLLRPVGLAGPLAARPRLDAGGRGGRPDQRRVRPAARPLPAAAPAHGTAVAAADRPDGGLRRRRRRAGPALLLQRRPVPLGGRRPAAGVPGAGAADLLALGPQRAPSRVVGLRRRGAGPAGPGLRAGPAQRGDAGRGRRGVGPGRRRLPLRLLRAQRERRPARRRPAAAADHRRHRRRRRRHPRRRRDRGAAPRRPDRQHGPGRLRGRLVAAGAAARRRHGGARVPDRHRRRPPAGQLGRLVRLARRGAVRRRLRRRAAGPAALGRPAGRRSAGAGRDRRRPATGAV
ncbi:MAG: hypothetical protein AVDCRST_MAG48-3206, partial [uncultured Friedmanniella sp.]